MRPRATVPYRFFDLLQQSTADPAVELRAGLAAAVAFISPKFFYDELGARLFEAICALPEYYLTRAERQILAEQAPGLAARFPARSAWWNSGAAARSRRGC